MADKKNQAADRAVANGPAEDQLPAYTPHPTAESPFDFPCTSASSHQPRLQQPIAIPQTAPTPTAPFLDAYAPPLLQYGITPETWRAFLHTLSAFLAAKVSDQALAHAADIGRQVGDVPKRFGQGTLDHARAVKNNVRDAARDGRFVSAALGAVGGAITLPVGTALRAVGATVSLPGAAVRAVAQKPQSPGERAAAYVAAANVKWLRERRLRACLADTASLARRLGWGDDAVRLLERAHAVANGEGSAAAQLAALEDCLCPLEVFTGSTLHLGVDMLWLVVEPEKDGGVGSAKS
ncbi:uncharacterized protein BO97DRAFT_408094 [Aspergillus homomorphus CBS 101889]|uniref:Uncharacterized protein n=1 Tax=Aspergillus homomorphus (strain CBS 101889) TaxID=1450537 RepID=A0A395HMY7_ASPHC|nr:hypothetical protein BO97DRAFT_408094 [Aspergillus homomorphus CBS 101889]RAL08849.1 hypothetical protein BO97DRAFT_408094 [Aspergillus homomorphus CBS 101889]